MEQVVQNFARNMISIVFFICCMRCDFGLKDMTGGNFRGLFVFVLVISLHLSGLRYSFCKDVCSSLFPVRLLCRRSHY